MIGLSFFGRVLVCVVVAGTMLAAHAADEEWTRHRTVMRETRAAAQYYSLHGIASNAAGFPNDCVEGELLQAPPGRFEVVSGPSQHSLAVRLDTTPMVGPAPKIGGQGFAVAAWMRVQGVGSVRGTPIARGGTLFSCGSGYWDGWRVTLKPDEGNSVGFEVGRPQPDHATFLQGGRLLTGVWHHLVATWDGAAMRVYIDGVQTAEHAHAHAYAQPSSKAFRVGVAGHGWGSSVFDVADLALYERGLSASEVVQQACLHAPLAEATANAFDAAWKLAAEGSVGEAVATFDAIAGQATAPCYAASALTQAAALLRRNGKPVDAAERVQAILQRDDVSARGRMRAFGLLTALLQDDETLLPAECYETALAFEEIPAKTHSKLQFDLARSLLAKGNLARAEPLAREVLAEQDLPARDACELMLDLGHGCRANGMDDQARWWYQQILDNADAPFGFHSHARLCMGQSFVDEKNWDGARAAFEALAADETAPAHHQTEARERIGEIARLELGLPAFDPATSRTPPPQWPTPGKVFHVSPDGKTGNAGDADAPFDSIQAARDAIRRLKQATGLPKGGVEVRVAAGQYPVMESIALTDQDSGTTDAPIVYRAVEAGAARLTGGRSIEGFKPVEDAAVLARLPEESHGRVLQVDLKALGIADYGSLRPTGATMGNHPLLELFFDGRAMRMARWPNEGYLKTGTVYDVGDEATDRGAVFDCVEDRLARWGEARDPWIFGFPRYLWSDASLPVGSIDAEAKRVTLGAFYAYGGGMQADMPFYFYNLLEEIDQPGEYYLDRDAGTLYFYPPKDIEAATAELSLSPTPLVTLTNVSHVAFEGLVFELGQTHAITIDNGSDCLFIGCTIRRLGGNGITIAGGTNHRVMSCDLTVLGMGGVRIVAGDRPTLTRADHLVENCHVYDFSRINRTYTPAVWMDGVGIRVVHNEFHHSPCHAVRLNGNEHTLEFNNVYDVLLESDDQGGLDMWFNPTYRGNAIRYNYWHDMGGNGFPCGQAGVRLDDAISETVVFGNVFRRCSHGHFGGVQIHGGKENYIENNLFIDCASAVSFSHWGEKRWADFFETPRTVEALANVNVGEPPYSTRYPALANLKDDPDINRIWRNIVYNCDEFLARDNGRQELMDNLVTSDDPGFVDAANGDYTLKPDAPALRAGGFRPIPFGAIGTYESEYGEGLALR
ncbi:MAG: hypothetical protein GY851_32555 [bacterium]|nr:hypothetical protein [bacterium]